MKKIISLLLSLVLALSAFSLNVFADGALHCPSCGGEVTKHGFQLLGIYAYFYQCNDCKKWSFADGVAGLKMLGVGDGALLDAADENTLMKVVFTNGHFLKGEQAPSGIGRKDLPGYADDNGTPSVGGTGKLQIIVNPSFKGNSSSQTWTEPGATGSILYGGSGYIDYSSTKLFFKFPSAIQDTFYLKYEFVAPIDGLYYFDSQKLVENYYIWKSEKPCSYSSNASSYASKGSTCLLLSKSFNFQAGYLSYTSVPSSYTVTVKPVVVTVVPDTTTIKSYNKITINNNNWNGNIYVDNSNNLTYIYPEYTTINENNETVTNISTNPIIYNSETKQYYTYDSVTNNYYYITYEPQATPTPSPSPTPDPGTNPTPTPNPGGGTVPTPGGSGSTSTPETGGSGSGSSWNPFKWLTDLLKDIVETILKGLWKLLTSIFGFILWLLSLLFKLFPWMPSSGILALCAGVVVVTVIRIIKFITGR